MRTTVDLPSGLLEEAMELAGTATKKETIVSALREYVRRLQAQALISELGTYQLHLTGEDLVRLRANEDPPGSG